MNPADAPVVILRPWERTPVFHIRRDGWRAEPAPRVTKSIRGLVLVHAETWCHEPVVWSRPRKDGDDRNWYARTSDRGLVLPRRHAERFGRPCAKCWPAPDRLDV